MIRLYLKKQTIIDTKLIFLKKRLDIFMNKRIKLINFMINMQRNVRIYCLIIPEKIYTILMIGGFNKEVILKTLTTLITRLVLRYIPSYKL